MMNELLIAATEKTPAVDMSYGILDFRGCSIIDHQKSFYHPVIQWVKKYLKNPAEETLVSIRLEYIDSTSAKEIYQMLSILKNLEEQGLVIIVNWYYEYGDVEMVELGEVIQGRLDIEFDFIEIID